MIIIIHDKSIFKKMKTLDYATVIHHFGIFTNLAFHSFISQFTSACWPEVQVLTYSAIGAVARVAALAQ